MTGRKRFIVITGAASGIGWASATDLAARGFGVVAGVLDEAELEEVRGRELPGVVPLLLDVTSPEQIEAAAAQIGDAARRAELVGLVNNAGIAVAGPLEFLPDRELRRQLDVNFFGAMAVTRALLPLLRESHGRVVNVGSVGGRLAAPHTGAYCASKFAMRSASDTLRMELRPARIHVALIEPGPIATPIWERSIADGQRRRAQLGPRALELYGEELDRVIEAARRAGEHGIPASRVAKAIRHALLARRPRPYYLVGLSARLQAFLGGWIPPLVRDPLLRRILGLDR